jgi:hypothetical protein
MMKIDVRGDALALLKDFVNGATGFYAKGVASALYYAEDAFSIRATLLYNAVQKAILEDEKK